MAPWPLYHIRFVSQSTIGRLRPGMVKRGRVGEDFSHGSEPLVIKPAAPIDVLFLEFVCFHPRFFQSSRLSNLRDSAVIWLSNHFPRAPDVVHGVRHGWPALSPDLSGRNRATERKEKRQFEPNFQHDFARQTLLLPFATRPSQPTPVRRFGFSASRCFCVPFSDFCFHLSAFCFVLSTFRFLRPPFPVSAHGVRSSHHGDVPCRHHHADV